jgi:hypothetical protein
MPDPLDRLNLAQQKIDELFGPNYARCLLRNKSNRLSDVV